MRAKLFCFIVLTGLVALANEPPSSSGFSEPVRRSDAKPLAIQEFVAPILVPQVLRSLPHDPECYTQGLTFSPDGRCYESSGGYNRSEVREIDPQTGAVLRRQKLSDDWWAEGLCWSQEALVLLTWQNRLVSQVDPQNLSLGRRKRWDYEGWGAASRGADLFISDGTDRLFCLDATSWQVRATCQVRDGTQAVDLINELEFVGQDIYANVWLSDYVAIIDPQSGVIQAWLDCRRLLTPEEQRKADFLNGIAYNAQADELYLTGKFWPKMFVIAHPTGGWSRPPRTENTKSELRRAILTSLVARTYPQPETASSLGMGSQGRLLAPTSHKGHGLAGSSKPKPLRIERKVGAGRR